MAFLTSCCPAMADENVNEPPNMALLEYLAELVEVNGELIGPLDLQNDENAKKETQPKENEPVAAPEIMDQQDKNVTQIPSSKKDIADD